MPLDRPIFIVAPPRCGTTLLYQCLVAHPDVGFFNRANRNFPESPRLARFVTRFGGLLGVYRDTPRESRALWFRFLPSERELDTADEKDARSEARAWFERTIGEVLRLRGATRYASKLPAHSAQLPYLDAMFPGALFVQPLRDWRAVVASTVVKRARDFPGQWFGVRMPGWQEAAKLAPHLGAAWQYRAVHEYLVAQAPRYPGRFLPVNYEELVAAPRPTMARVFDFCGLRSDASTLDRLPAMRPANERWKETLTPEKLAEIERVHGDFLRRYEFASVASLEGAAKGFGR
jgi:hypothetical protein